ncbi:transglutaminase domain-containing protein [Paenibacillus sp. sgz500958]|uniref:transglutaminase domain-containing protein n=1 Tax=Paenibacillus sp. sgz500958 TaxID=3242475 RepID=UPI0036D31862
MLNQWVEHLSGTNLISILLILTAVFSIVQGFIRGFFHSIRRLFGMLGSSLFTIAALVLAIAASLYLSPRLQVWMSGLQQPDRALKAWEQIWYTLVAVLADSPVLRFLVILAVTYSLIRLVLSLLTPLLPMQKRIPSRIGDRKISTVSRLGGGAIGALIGAARCLFIIVMLFILVGMNPDSQFSQYVESSPVYRQGASTVIEPIAGKTMQDKLPVLTEIVAAEMDGILRRKYEVIDRDIPADIQAAAASITGKSSDEEEKARLLYDWIGTRISYDYAKAENYEQNRIWHEQTPQDTFDTRLGVCIDYARLYAVMARSQNLEVRVVTGQGYDGRGGYGPHAWNEVYIEKQQAWIPLDSTWAQSGDWFNPQDFSSSHIKEDVL